MKRSVLVIALLGAGVGSACAQGPTGVYGVQDAGIVSRQHNLEYLALTDVGDVFKGGMAGSNSKLFGSFVGNFVGNSGRQPDNSFNLYGRDANGVSPGASYGVGERDPAANRAWGLSVGFERGPLAIRLAHQNRIAAPVAPATPMGNNMDAKNSILAANLRLGSATAYAAYSANRGWGSSPLFNPDNPYSASMASTPSLDSRDVLVGLALPCGPTTLLASYVRKNDRDLANLDANQVAFGASYALSRRTDFYASYSRITNRGGAGNASPGAAGVSALNLGMRHGF